ncbi:MAG: glycosyl hydrolase family 65 protein, partial [Bacillota bacterium]
IMQTVFDELNTKYGVRLMAPPYRKEAFSGAAMILFNPGAKENGSIFCQPQGWAIFAEALLGHGNRAFQYFAESSPASFNENADVRVIEPYAHGQFIESVESPYFGRAQVHWLTGTASTVMVGCVEGILGLRPTPDGIVISPSIPSEWRSFTMKKNYRGKILRITVNNPRHRESGVRTLVLNGLNHSKGLIRFEELQDDNEICITL